MDAISVINVTIYDLLLNCYLTVTSAIGSSAQTSGRTLAVDSQIRIPGTGRRRLVPLITFHSTVTTPNVRFGQVALSALTAMHLTVSSRRQKRAIQHSLPVAAFGRSYPSGGHRGLGGAGAWGGGWARPAVGECGDALGQPIDVEDMGIEVVREPFFEFAMALVVGRGDGLGKL